MADARHSGETDALGPDAKSQVTVRYENGTAVGVTSIVVSTQHTDEDLTSDDVRAIVHDVLRHRIMLSYEANAARVTTQQVISEIVKVVAVA